MYSKTLKFVIVNSMKCHSIQQSLNVLPYTYMKINVAGVSDRVPMRKHSPGMVDFNVAWYTAVYIGP